MTGRLAIAALVLAITLPGVVCGQTRPVLRGDVVLSDGTTHPPGVIVEVASAAGEVAGRALTGTSGRFELSLPAEGAYSARALRIGFRPTEVTAFTVTAAGPNTLHIVLGEDHVRLTQVTVKGEDVCRIRADAGKLVAQVWEQARQALFSTQLTAAEEMVRATVLTFDRILDSTGREVRRQQTSVETASTGHAFYSMPADSLARFGYAFVRNNDMMEYFGPDAEAIISDHFAATHCFRVLPPSPEWPKSVGVAFRPARDREGIVDIAGIFWLDRESAELHLLEYRYTNLPTLADRTDARGRIEFVRLATGNWLVNRWNIRADLVPRRGEAAADSRARSARGRAESQPVPQFQRFVFGGEVTAASRDGRELYDSIGAVLDAVVTASPGSPLVTRGAAVELVGPHYFTVGDDSGRVHFARLRAGTYAALAMTAEMVAVGLPAVPRTVQVPSGSGLGPERIALPTGDELLAAKCGDGAAKRREAFVVGTLRSAAGSLRAGDTVFVKWSREGPLRAEARSPRMERFTAITGSDGRWFACGLTRGARMTIDLVPEAETETRPVDMDPSLAFVVLHLQRAKDPRP
jgi:hypothetical protein